MDSAAATAETRRSRPLRLLILLGRVYLPCLIASPFAVWSSILMSRAMTGGPEGPSSGAFEDINLLLLWSGMLFAGALLIGLPLTVWITRVLRPWWARTLALVGLGGTVHVLPGVLVIGSDTAILYSAPAGAFTALCCCVVNFDKLRQPRPHLV